MTERLKLLLVNRDADAAQQLAPVAVRHGFRVALAYSTAEAMDWLEHESFDVVISEIGFAANRADWRRVHQQSPSSLIVLAMFCWRESLAELAQAA
jgi:DNA-binding response OmpR family regulator